jgi:hypothetical protein
VLELWSQSYREQLSYPIIISINTLSLRIIGLYTSRTREKKTPKAVGGSGVGTVKKPVKKFQYWSCQKVPRELMNLTYGILQLQYWNFQAVVLIDLAWELFPFVYVLICNKYTANIA